MHYTLQDGQIAARWDRLEKAPAHNLTAIEDSCPLKIFRRVDNLRLIGEDTARTSMNLENLGQEIAMPAPTSTIGRYC